MGLSIHYSGSFNPSASLPEMIEEIADIVGVFQWPCRVYQKQFPELSFSSRHDDQVYGVVFTPPECETVSLCFLSNGRLSDPVRLRFFGDHPDESLLYTLSVKTQFAGIRTHMLVINLLKYISRKYFAHFRLSDEGKYWETEDEELLREKFDLYNALLGQFTDAVQTFPMNQGETFKAYFSRILKHIKRKE